MTLTNNQRYTPRWAELAEAPPEAELARSAQAVWVSPTETFLSTLIRCVKEQSENEVPPSEVISADSAAAEQFDESICAPQSARPSTRPHMCRWSFMVNLSQYVSIRRLSSMGWNSWKFAHSPRICRIISM